MEPLPQRARHGRAKENVSRPNETEFEELVPRILLLVDLDRELYSHAIARFRSDAHRAGAIAPCERGVTGQPAPAPATWVICTSSQERDAGPPIARHGINRRASLGVAIMSRLTSFLRALAARASTVETANEPSRLPVDARWGVQLLPLLSPDFPIAVCWSAKAGCTTILKWFLAHNGLLEEAVSHSRWVHDYREQCLCVGHTYRHRCRRLFSHDRADKHIIKVIRDPARRAVSGYLHLLRCEHHQSWPAGAAVSRWKRETGLDRQQGLSFRQFLQFLADQQRMGRDIDLHFRPQYDPRQDPRVHTHVPLEHLAAGLNDLERLFRLPHIDVRSLSDSPHHNTPTRHCHWSATPSAVPADSDTLEKLGTPSAEAFLDPKTVAAVREVYRIDYEAYGSVYTPAEATPSTVRAACAAGENARCDLPSLSRRAA